MKPHRLFLTLVLAMILAIYGHTSAGSDVLVAPPPPDKPIYLPLIVRAEDSVLVESVLTPFDGTLSDLYGPSSWSTNYGKAPEIIVASNGSELDVLAQDYDSATGWTAVLLHIKPSVFSSIYYVSQALTGLPMLDRVMGLAVDASGNRYYATAVDERAVVDRYYPADGQYRSNIVRVVKVNKDGAVQFNIDLDTARHSFDANAEQIINPMTAATARLAVGGSEIAIVHGINTDPDPNLNGARHQKALSTRLNASTGAITSTSSIWVSHSFDERLLYDGQAIVEYHLGDAYPRYLALGRKLPTDPYFKSYSLFDIKGALGENNTYTRLGNIALIEGDATYRYLALFATESNAITGDDINGPRNLAIVRAKNSDVTVDPNLPDTLSVFSVNNTITNRLKWLTHYSAESNLHAERPKLIAVGGNKFVVLWEEWQKGSGNWWEPEPYNGVYGMLIDSAGNILIPAKWITGAVHLPRGDDAFLLNGKAGWMTGSAANKTLSIHLVDALLNYTVVTLN